MIRSSHHRVEKMGHFWYATIVVQYFLIVTTSSEEFTNEDTSQRWTIPNVYYPDPTFIYNIRSTMDIISSQGFPVEKHFIQTEDGYILALHRIPGRGIPVLILHGLLGSSDQWIFRDDSTSDLPFILSKYGYDVWLGNLRGNVYSRHHTNLSPDSLEFWNFSWHEYGSRDLPAMIELVRYKSGQDRLVYMGYSLGGGIPYILADTRPEYTRYIRLNILLAPFVYGPTEIKSTLIRALRPILDYALDKLMNWKCPDVAEMFPRTNPHIPLIFSVCGDQSVTAPLCNPAVEDIVGKYNSFCGHRSITEPLCKLTKLINWKCPEVAEILPRTNSNIALIFSVCGDHSVTAPLCKPAVEDIAGKDNSKNFNIKNMDRLLSNTFEGTSLKVLYHIWSMFKTGRFLKFEALPMNEKKSIKQNQSDQKYDVTWMTAPNMMWYSHNNRLLSLEDWKFDTLPMSQKRPTEQNQKAQEYDVTKMAVPNMMWYSHNDRSVDWKFDALPMSQKRPTEQNQKAQEYDVNNMAVPNMMWYSHNDRSVDWKFDALPMSQKRSTKQNQREQEYDVTRMTVPTMMWYSHNDRLVDWKGVEKLASLTPNMVHLNLISPEPFNHLDYWVHEDINQLVHFELLNQLSNFLKSSE